MKTHRKSRNSTFLFGTHATMLVAVLASLFGNLEQSKAGILFEPEYYETISFLDGLPQYGTFHTMGLAHDGTYYWSVSGGQSNGQRFAQHNGVTGAVLATYAPGLDFRSVFTDLAGTLYARTYKSRTIYKQTSPGVFVPSGVTLTGGSLDTQSAVVVYSHSQDEYIAHKDGIVSRWDNSGAFISTVELLGYGSVIGELAYPADRGIAAGGDCWLTYSNGILSAWDYGGIRIDQTTLIGAGTTFDSHFSFSYTNGMAFVNDGDGMWRGYDVGPIPEPVTVLLLGLGGLFLRKRGSR